MLLMLVIWEWRWDPGKVWYAWDLRFSFIHEVCGNTWNDMHDLMLDMVCAWVMHEVRKHSNGVTISTSAHVACNGVVKAEKGSFVTKISVKRKGYLVGHCASMIPWHSSWTQQLSMYGRSYLSSLKYGENLLP